MIDQSVCSSYIYIYIHIRCGLFSLDPWYQVGFVLTTGVNSAYVLGYAGSIMVHLGWIAGTTGLLLAAAISLYANALLARLHEVGGKRHIRYRDLAGYIYGNFSSLLLLQTLA